MSPNPNEAAAHWPCPNHCEGWCRTDFRPMTNHHPRCEYVDKSLIDVWRVTIPGEGGGCLFDREECAKAFADENSEPNEPLQINKEKMHKEIYDNLDEFAGF